MSQNTFWDVHLKVGRPRNGLKGTPNVTWRKETKCHCDRFKQEECRARRTETAEEKSMAHVYQVDALVKTDSQDRAALRMLVFMTKTLVHSLNLSFVSDVVLMKIMSVKYSHSVSNFLVSYIMIPRSLFMAALLLVTGFLVSLLRTMQLKSEEARYQKVPNVGLDGQDVPGTSVNGHSISYQQTPTQFNYAIPEEKINTYCVIDSRLVDS